ncbi:MAG TPA: F0F1 ATP synthase subunit epsilon [Nitrolancea sp.]|nr:F0F1 ATP synthase subunit epsilon [Nitrolancea sp.]
MAKLRVEIVTGERIVLDEDDVDMVIAPGADGTLGILPRHAPLISTLAIGEMRVKRASMEESIFIAGGFIEVAHDQVRVLADTAERSEEIDLARAQAARDRAETRVSSRTSEIDVARAEASLRRSIVRLRIGQRTHGRQAAGARSSTDQRG